MRAARMRWRRTSGRCKDQEGNHFGGQRRGPRRAPRSLRFRNRTAATSTAVAERWQSRVARRCRTSSRGRVARGARLAGRRQCRPGTARCGCRRRRAGLCPSSQPGSGLTSRATAASAFAEPFGEYRRRPLLDGVVPFGAFGDDGEDRGREAGEPHHHDDQPHGDEAHAGNRAKLPAMAIESP